MTFVIDASVTLVWAFSDEQHAIAQRAEELLKTGTGAALVPELWWYEIRNILLFGERRGRISAAGTAQFLNSLANLRIEMDAVREEQPVLELARQYRLTIYDAAYLALAIRERLPLATLDKALALAARNAGIPLLG